MMKTAFVIERAPGNSGFVAIDTVAADSTIYADSSLSANSTFSYRVFAINSGGVSGTSNVATTNTYDLPPAAPVNLSATAVSALQVTLSWDDVANNETAYRGSAKW